MNELQKISTFERKLAIAETFEEVKQIEHYAEAMAKLMEAENIGLDKQNELGRFRIEITEKKGIWLDENYPNGRSNRYTVLENTQNVTSKMPVSNHESANSRKISRTDTEVKAQIMDEIEEKGEVITPKKVLKEIKKLKKVKDLQEQKENIEASIIPEIKDNYNIIVIDPPWNYGRKYDPETSRVANPYPEMTQKQLKEFKIHPADDSIIFLWTTHAFIWDAKELLDLWGFKYKATLVWNKEKIGMGAWFRMQCEFCLVGIKGKPYFKNTTWRDIISEPRREHSRKPEVFYNMVDDITAGKKIEYFSREQREGWEVYGNDTDKFLG